MLSSKPQKVLYKRRTFFTIVVTAIVTWSIVTPPKSELVTPPKSEPGQVQRYEFSSLVAEVAKLRAQVASLTQGEVQRREFSTILEEMRTQLASLIQQQSVKAKHLLSGQSLKKLFLSVTSPNSEAGQVQRHELEMKTVDQALKVLEPLHQQMDDQRVAHRRHSKSPVDVPVYVLTLGGERQKLIEKELHHEQVNFTIVTQPPVLPANWEANMESEIFHTDYPIDKGEAGCTRAHVAFAGELLKAGHRCGLVLEDDASLSLSPYWPLSLSELCDTMFQHDPKWTTLKIYVDSSHYESRSGCAFELVKFKQPNYGTVAYLATQAWAQRLLNITHNNTRLFQNEVQSDFGVADSAIYGFHGERGYVLTTGLVYPNNIAHTSVVRSTEDHDLLDHLNIAVGTISIALNHLLLRPIWCNHTG